MSYKRQFGLLAICLTIASFASGAPQVPPATMGPSIGTRNAITEKDLKSPFSYFYNVSVDLFSNYKTCALVEQIGDAKLEKREVIQSGRAPQVEEYIEFKIKVLQGVGVKEGMEYTCLAPRVKPHPSALMTNRFLLLGWLSNGNELRVNYHDPRYNSAQFDQKVKVSGDAIFVGSLIPTVLKDIKGQNGSVQTAFVNLARAIAAGTDSSSVRAITHIWVLARPDNQNSIDGIRVYSWLTNNIGPILGEHSRTTPVEKLRICGLLSDWFKPKGTLEYIRSLSDIIRNLRKDDWVKYRESESLDLTFIKRLQLGTRANTDEIYDIALSDSALYYLVLDRSLRQPSEETQRRMLSLLDVQDIDLRAGVYRTYANWYGKRDWVLTSAPTYNRTTGHFCIPHEAEMKNYWHEKLAGAAKP